jgi:hypothetical protein
MSAHERIAAIEKLCTFRNFFDATVLELNRLVVLNADVTTFDVLPHQLQDALVYVHTELVNLRHKLNSEIKEAEYQSQPPKSPGIYPT